MYRPPQNAVDDVPTLHRAIRSHPFATIAHVSDDRIAFAYAPVVVDEAPGVWGGVRFHLAKANPLAASDGTRLFFSFRGPDGYISPDWYRSASMVPTWNYVAIEAAGPASFLDEDGLRTFLVDLSAQEEARLAPKAPWTIDKVPKERQAALMHAIVGFSVRFESLKGKFKLSQEKSDADFDGVLEGLAARGDTQSGAVVSAMKAARKSRL